MLICLLVCAVLGAVLWLFFVVFPFLKQKSLDEINVDASVTVLVCAKNEANHIANLIEHLKHQTYSNFKVCIIDDGSTDGTFNLAIKAAGGDDRFSIRRIDETKKRYRGKKGVVDYGYQCIDSCWILHTDADCVPASKHWIGLMLSKASSKKTELVLGIGDFINPNSWWHHILFGEAKLIAMQYIGMALSKHPYMAVGRNMLVKKSLYKRVKFDDFVLSGDDDLLVQQYANEENTSVQINKRAHTLSSYPSSFSAYINMKKRHLTTAPFYGIRHKLLLLVWPLSLACSLCGLFTDLYHWFLAILFIKFVGTQLVMRLIYRQHFGGLLILVESYLLIQTSLVYLANVVKPKTTWK